MATLDVVTVTSAGVDIAGELAAVSATGDEFANDGNTYIEIRNSSAENTYTVTVVATRSFQGYPIEDETIAIAESEEVVAGPFPTDVFNSSTGRVALTYTGSAPATDLTIVVFRGARL